MAVCRSHWLRLRTVPISVMGLRFVVDTKKKSVENGYQSVATSIPADRTVSQRGKVDDSGTNLVLRISETELF